jgi:hypothetical protein
VDAKAGQKLAVLVAYIAEVSGAAENLAGGTALANSTVNVGETRGAAAAATIARGRAETSAIMAFASNQSVVRA